jgi:hypothetical protein
MTKRNPKKWGSLKVRITGTFEVPVWALLAAVVVVIALIVILLSSPDKTEAISRILAAIIASLPQLIS